MEHNHDHSHHHSDGNVKVAFFLNLSFTIIEIIGGLYTNSLAILSDALHDFNLKSKRLAVVSNPKSMPKNGESK